MHQRGLPIATASTDDGVTALHFAAAGGHRQAAEQLLQLGSDMHARTKSTKSSVLHFAAESGNVDLLRALLRHVGAGSGTHLDVDTVVVWLLDFATARAHAASAAGAVVAARSIHHLVGPVCAPRDDARRARKQEITTDHARKKWRFMSF